MEKFLFSHRIHRTHRILMIYGDDKVFFEFTDLSQFHATAGAVFNAYILHGLLCIHARQLRFNLWR